MKSKYLFLWTIFCYLGLALPVAAQSYPSKTIRILVGFSAGSTADLLPRNATVIDFNPPLQKAARQRNWRPLASAAAIALAVLPLEIAPEPLSVGGVQAAHLPLLDGLAR